MGVAASRVTVVPSGADHLPAPDAAGHRRPPAPRRGRRGVPPHRQHARAAQERGPARAGVRPGARLAARTVATGDRRARRVGARNRRNPRRRTTSSSPAPSRTRCWPSSTAGPVPLPTSRSPRATACRPWRPCAPVSRRWCPTRCRACTTSAKRSPRRARVVDPLDVDDIAAGLAAVLTDDIAAGRPGAPGRRACVGAHLARRGRGAPRPVAVAAVTDDRLALSLDVSAVPARPGGAGYYTMALAHGLAGRDDVGLTLVARRGDEERWHGLGRWRVGARRGPRLAAGPAGLRAAPPRVRAAFARGAGPPRSALHDAVTVAGALRGDDPRLHLLRPSGMASALEGGLLPPRHPPRRTSGRRAGLRQPGHGGTAACVLRRPGPGRGGAARGRPRAVHAAPAGRGSRPGRARRAGRAGATGRSWRSSARSSPARGWPR